MPGYDFPNSPTLGQIITNGGVQYRWDSQKWTVMPGGSAGIPEAPTDGQSYVRRGSDASWQVATGGSGSYLPLTGGTVTGATTFSAAGTGLTVTNNATVGGTFATTGASYTFGAGGTSTFDFIQSGTGNVRLTLGGTASIFNLRGVNGSSMLRVNSTSLPVNYFNLTPANAGGTLFFDTGGTDTNVSLQFRAQGAGTFSFAAPLLANSSFLQTYTVAAGSVGPSTGTAFRQNASVSGSGAMAAWNGFNQWNVNADTAALTGFPMWHTQINYNFGGGAYAGNRGGLNVNMVQAGAVSGSSGSGGVNPFWAGSTINNTFGGTNSGPGAAGAVFGGGFQTKILNGVVNLLGTTGCEIDVEAATGAIYQYLVGLQVISTTQHTQAGVNAQNIGIVVAGQTNSIGLDVAYGVNAWGVSSGATLFRALYAADRPYTFSAARGIDLRPVTFSSDIFAASGFTVGPTGRVRVGTGYIDYDTTGLIVDVAGAVGTGGTLTGSVTTTYASDGNSYTASDPYGGIWSVTFASGSSSITAITMQVAPNVKGATPANPITLTPDGALRKFGPGTITANLTWSTTRTGLALQPSGGAVTAGGSLTVTGAVSAASVASSGLLTAGTVAIGSIPAFNALGANMSVVGGALTSSGGGGGGGTLVPNVQTASYTLVAGDANDLVIFNAAANVTATLPSPATFGTNVPVDISNINTGVVTISVGSGTIDTGGSTLLLAQGMAAKITNDGTNWRTEKYYQPTTGATGGIGIGNANTVTGSSTPSFALGSSNNVSANGAVAMGTGNVLSSQTCYAIGLTNTITAGNQVAIGASNVISGSSVNIAIGQSLIASGTYSTLMGYRINDRGNLRDFAFGWGGADATSPNQAEEYHHMHISTTGTVAVRLTTDAQAAGFANVAAIANKQAAMVDMDVLITDITNMKSNTYYTAAPAILTRGTAVATTVLTGMTLTAGPTHGGGLTLGAVPTAAADTTFGGLNISFTPPAGNTATIRGQAYIRYRTARYN